MLDAMRHDHALSRPQGHDPISEFNPKPAAPNHEKFALCFHELDLLPVQRRDGLRSPMFAEQREFFLQADFVHVRLLLACLLSHSLLAFYHMVYSASEDSPMIFRQLFDSTSGTYTYLLASRAGGEALIIDPVLEKVERYLQLVRELDLKLVKAVDTHLHADHITGLGALRDRTHCITVMGEQTNADVVSMRVAEGDRIEIEGLRLDVLYTPGHTDDSYSFLLPDRIFTGDTLLIRGTGRTDFQNGDPRAQYDSIFNK